MSIHSKVKTYGAVVRTRKRSRLAPKPKQDKASWQRRNEARSPLQTAHAEALQTVDDAAEAIRVALQESQEGYGALKLAVFDATAGGPVGE